VLRPRRVLGIGAILLLLVIGGWFIDAQRVPEIRNCDPKATRAQWQRCADAEYAKIEPALAYMDRLKWWRWAAIVVVLGSAGACVASLALTRKRDAPNT
jgi:hypothetical protein